MNEKPSTLASAADLRHRAEARLRERVEMVGGDLGIKSAPGQGTTIRAQVPFRTSPARGEHSRMKSASTTPCMTMKRNAVFLLPCAQCMASL